MENRKQQSGIDSVHDTSAFSCGLFATVAAISCGCSSFSPSWHGNVAAWFSLELSASRWRLWF